MIKRIVFCLFFVFIMIGCTNNSGMKTLMENEGYTNIEPTGYRFFMCSQDDFYHTGFKATKNGKVVTGAVCEGIFLKGKTIRYD